MKTLFVTLFQGIEAKNILRTDIYKNLINQSDVRIVFFVKTKERAEYYKREFSGDKVIYEVAGENKRKDSLLDKMFNILKFLLLKTETMDLRRKMALEIDKNYPRYIFDWFANRLLARSFIRKIARFLDWHLVRENRFSVYFDRYNPNAVFLAHLFDDVEICLLREAKKRGVRTIGFVNSWDKLTARCILRLLPDKLIVFNDIVKEEAVQHADMPENYISVTGIPQYDRHVNKKPVPRREFFAKIRCDASKKLIVYAPMGKAYSNSDWEIIDLLQSFIDKNLVKEAQLFVRFQPNDFVDFKELKKRLWLKYDLPGIRFSSERGIDWDMSSEDIAHLTDTLYHADLFICYASSMSIDAAIFNKPVINIDFELKNEELMSKSPTHFYKMTHYRKAAATGGMKFVNNEEELLEWINLYLEHPDLDQEKRQELVRSQCWRLDGASAKRIADIIKKELCT